MRPTGFMTGPRDADLEDYRRRLQRWLGDQEPGGPVRISGLSWSEQGFSNETAFGGVAFDGDPERPALPIVVRAQGSGPGLYPVADVLRQRDVMAALARTPGAPPVPQVLWSCADPSVLGSPFFIMAEVPGRTLGDRPSWHAEGWATELPPADRGRLYQNAVAGLVQLHDLPIAAAPEWARSEAGGESPLARHVRAVSDWYRWAAAGRAVPVVESALEFLGSTMPPESDPVILWGDARPGNMIFSDDLSVAALLDWEACSIGPAEIDLGWWLIAEDLFSDNQGVDRLAGTLRRDELKPEYERLSGRQLNDLHYFEVLGATTFALIMLRHTDILVASGKLPESTQRWHRNAAAKLLASLLSDRL